jgi:ATP-dependent DNA ligase
VLAIPRPARLLEALTFGAGYHVSPRFDDRATLWQAVVDQQLEGVVAKKLHERYKRGERAMNEE